VKPDRPDLHSAREAFERGSYRSAYDLLSAAAGPLDQQDLWRLAVASYLIGREDDFVQAAQRAHHAQLECGDARAAARTAFWIGFHLAGRGDIAQATGWFGRTARLLEPLDPECADRAYLHLPAAHQQLLTGDPDAAANTAARAVAAGQRAGDGDLLALGLMVQGRALVKQGRVEAGLALLDEAMVAVATGELAPQVTGLLYCSVIGACRDVWAVRRLREWTAALADWCARQPDMVAYEGECRVYRAEILQLRGEWRDAAEESRRALERLATARTPGAAGLACYQQGELHRLRGELAAAEESYRAASRYGREPQPGLALLRQAQGDRQAAAASIRRAVAETRDRLQRARLLPALIDIMLECGATAEAAAACEELSDIAQACASGHLATIVARARGAIELANGNPLAALPLLRGAWRDWQDLDAPYDAARTRVLIGRACAALGDVEAASLELDAARSEFERLGATPDAATVAALMHGATRHSHGLTPRELDVLALLATGRTNRAIGAALSISEKTVARHVANIFGKLGLSSRAAATAYAFQHGLVNRST
jgi:ATP/maltotriose-dependent transcriptional regulator MalT